jgi:hypothetical protein
MRRRKFDRDEEVGAALRSLPVRAASPEFFTRLRNAVERSALEGESVGSSAPSEAGRRSRHRRIAVLAATAVVSALVGALTTASVYAVSPNHAGTGSGRNEAAVASESSVTTFEPVEGWNIVLTTIDPNNTQDLPIVWAANVPFSPEESTSGFPSNTVRGLSPNGIVMTVIGPREYIGETVFPLATFPLTISQGFCSHDQYETQPAPHVSECLVDTMVGDRLLNVTVWFGMNTPSEEMYDEANAQLARLVVPG